MSTTLPLLILLIAAIAAFVAGAFLVRGKGRPRPGQVVARCRRGHLFMTRWGGGGFPERIDLGWARIQRCPVGDHWTLVVPVGESELTEEKKRLAKKYRDDAR